jgi:hypothetical protein
MDARLVLAAAGAARADHHGAPGREDELAVVPVRSGVPNRDGSRARPFALLKAASLLKAAAPSLRRVRLVATSPECRSARAVARTRRRVAVGRSSIQYLVTSAAPARAGAFR